MFLLSLDKERVIITTKGYLELDCNSPYHRTRTPARYDVRVSKVT